jgi:hypothetical protein
MIITIIGATAATISAIASAVNLINSKREFKKIRRQQQKKRVIITIVIIMSKPRRTNIWQGPTR